IEVKCFERIAGEEPNGVRSRQLRGVFRVALNLEKLGDYAVNISEQAVHVSRLKARPIPFDLAGPARIALAALDEGITAFTDARARGAPAPRARSAPPRPPPRAPKSPSPPAAASSSSTASTATRCRRRSGA